MATDGPTPEQLITQHLSEIPHAVALGFIFHAVGDDYVEIALPYADHLVGDPDTGVIHGGAITALLDNAAGFVARPRGADPASTAIATLDLRIDYMGAATPHRSVIARAHCYHQSRTIAFVRGTAFHDSPEVPIATCTAAFMIGTPNAPKPVAA